MLVRGSSVESSGNVWLTQQRITHVNIRLNYYFYICVHRPQEKSILWFGSSGSSIPIEKSSRMFIATEIAFVKSANVVCASAVAKVERECKIFLSFIAFCGSQLLFQFSFYTLNVKTVPKQFSTTNAFKEMLR